MDILIVDDHPLLRAGLWCLLEQSDGLAVVGAAADGHQALELAERLRPDVVLLDICMPGLDGIETTRRLRRSSGPPAVVMLTSACTPALVQDAFQAGAEGYLLKDTPADALVALLHGMEQGRQAIDPRAARALARLRPDR